MSHAPVASAAADSPHSGVVRPLAGLLVAQFLGAFNDNAYKMVLSLLAVTGSAESSGVLPLIGALFILPFLLCSGYAGHLADAYSKRRIFILAKILEIVVMGLGILAFLSQHLPFMLVVLVLMAAQSTLLSPAKYGLLPEIVPASRLSQANGWLEMSTFLAIILGTAVGSVLFTWWQQHLALLGLVFTVLAVLGTLASLAIPQGSSTGVRRPWRRNPWGEIALGIRRLYSERSLWLVALGIGYFWFLGALLQMDLILLGKQEMGLDELRLGMLQTFLAVGIGLGSLAAGWLSGPKIEFGLVPLGAAGIGITTILLATLEPAYPVVGGLLVLLGGTAGLFIIPLNAFLQYKSNADEKGRLLATANFLSTVGILLASGVLWLCRDALGWTADAILLLIGAATLLGTGYVLRLLPVFFIRLVLWLLTHTLYRIRILGQEHVPLRGPALLVCNHLSFIDAFLVGACVQRFVRFLVWKGFYERPLLGHFLRMMQAIPVAAGDRRAVVTALSQARTALQQGHVVCIFAEGAISRTGNLLPFKRGFEHIAHGLDVPVIPVHLDRIWGSIFSFHHGTFFWKWPRRWPYPVTVSFGKPLPATASAYEVRQAMTHLHSNAFTHRPQTQGLLTRRFLRMARRHWGRFCMADSTGKRLTFGKLLIGSTILARWLRRHCQQEQMIGLLLPASVGGAVANLAVSLTGKIPVNLNFTSGPEAMQAAIEQCGIRTILTSQQFLDKASLPRRHDMVFLETLLQEVTLWQKVGGMLAALFLPAAFLARPPVATAHTSEALATVVFSSGSTGAPKGVMLSHQNILSNIESMAQIFPLDARDCMMGILPFFHAFGFTVTLWFPLLTGCSVVYHPNPMDGKKIGEMVQQHRATMLISTPTFYGMYLRQCPPEVFQSLRYTIVGAEKLRPALAAEFQEKYGITLLEGYGCTEMGPVVAVNVPDVVQDNQRQIGHKPGTVGHPIPGVTARVVHVETGEPLPPHTAGLLLVNGPNRMLGYLGQAERTATVLRDGWYVTGDIATIDEDGFICITDRLARFSKMGGEMVPHLAIEDAVNAVLGTTASLVTAVPDAQRGERLVVLYTHPAISRDQLWEGVMQSALPKLWVPKREHFFVVDALPLLGTGKIDLQEARQLAQRLLAEQAA